MNRFAYKMNDCFMSYMQNKEQLPGKKSRKITRNESKTLFTRLGSEYSGNYNFKGEKDKSSVTFGEWCKLRKKKTGETFYT